jgi:hypothetical protein
VIADEIAAFVAPPQYNGAARNVARRRLISLAMAAPGSNSQFAGVVAELPRAPRPSGIAFFGTRPRPEKGGGGLRDRLNARPATEGWSGGTRYFSRVPSALRIARRRERLIARWLAMPHSADTRNGN